MKKITLIGTLLAIACVANAQSYYYDSFDYTLGNLGSSTGPIIPATYTTGTPSTTAGNWNYGSTKGAVVQSGTLSYSGLLTSATSTNDIKLVNTGSSVNQRMGFSTTDITSAIYYSFLMNVATAPTATTRVASLIGTTRTDVSGLGTYTSNLQIDASGKILLAPDNNGITLATAITTSSVVGTTVFVVVKYDPSTYKTDVWVNPAAADLGTASAPTPTKADIVGGATTGTNGFTFKTGLGVVNAEIDELRIGSSWAQVTPAASTSIIGAISDDAVSVSFKGNSLEISGMDGSKLVSLYSADGKLVKSVSTEGNQVNAAGLQTGIYIVKLSSAKGAKSYKAVKK